MMLNIFSQFLYKLVTRDSETIALFNNINLLLIPIVNLDSFTLITKMYDEGEGMGGPLWKTWKMIRKNRHFDSDCDGLDYGVDLNRNYGYKFAYDSIGSSNQRCEEDYRGKKAFSEPETMAVKNVIEERGARVVSAMNFHCYGNLWIHPFNYINDKNNNP